jgi:hypothetical protein
MELKNFLSDSTDLRLHTNQEVHSYRPELVTSFVPLKRTEGRVSMMWLSLAIRWKTNEGHKWFCLFSFCNMVPHNVQQTATVRRPVKVFSGQSNLPRERNLTVNLAEASG